MINLNINNIVENAFGQILAIGIISFISLLGFILRQKIFTFLRNCWYRIYGLYIARFKKARFFLIKRGNPIYLVSKEGKKRHIPDWRTYEILGEILDFKTSDCKVISELTAKTIEDDIPIPTLIKVEEIFSDTFNTKRAKILLQFIYKKFLWRDPDASGERGYMPLLEKKGFDGLVEVVEAIKKSPEFSQRHN